MIWKTLQVISNRKKYMKWINWSYSSICQHSINRKLGLLSNLDWKNEQKKLNLKICTNGGTHLVIPGRLNHVRCPPINSCRQKTLPPHCCFRIQKLGIYRLQNSISCSVVFCLVLKSRQNTTEQNEIWERKWRHVFCRVLSWFQNKTEHDRTGNRIFLHKKIINVQLKQQCFILLQTTDGH